MLLLQREHVELTYDVPISSTVCTYHRYVNRREAITANHRKERRRGCNLEFGTQNFSIVIHSRAYRHPFSSVRAVREMDDDG
jgi:hypothetical protein